MQRAGTNNMNKKYLLYAIVSVVALVSVGGFVLADSTNANGVNPMANIVSAIAEKFNLNASDVQAVFDEQREIMETNRKEHREEMQADMQEKFTERINRAVVDGKLTQVQADLIIAKKAELCSQQTNMEGKTREEILAFQKTQRDSLQQWAEDNNIPTEYIMFARMGHAKGFGNPDFRMGGQGPNNGTSSSTAQ